MLFDFIWQSIRIDTDRQNHGGKQKNPPPFSGGFKKR